MTISPHWQAIAERVRLGEDTRLELKRVVVTGHRVAEPRRQDLADELAAFANTVGGTLVLGIDDRTRQVIGIDLADLDTVEAWVRDACGDLVQPPLDVQIDRLTAPSASGATVPVVVVTVPRSLFVHRSPRGYCRRVGSACREMLPEQLARLLQERSQSRVIRYDESPVPRTTPGDLDRELTGRFFRGGETYSDVDLRKLRLVADDADGVSRLTIAAALMCTRTPARWLPHAEIQCVCYGSGGNGHADPAYQIDARDIGGPLDRQIHDALHFVRRNSRVEAIKTPARVERPQYSERAIFEALVNAVAHRDYSVAGSRIRLKMFNDRIELFVPGGLPNTLTPESMELRQYSRNELVVSLLARCPVGDDAAVGRAFLMDRRGDGVPIIIAETEKLSGRRPEYTVIDDSELRLVIWAAAPLSADGADRKE